MNQFSVEDYRDLLADSEEQTRMPQTQEELERLLVLAMYHEEIERKKLAAQLVMTLGEDCSQEMLIDVLQGAYLSATVSLAELQQHDIHCGLFSVVWQEDRVCVLISSENAAEAAVFVDCEVGDGLLDVGQVLYQTVEHTVFAFEKEYEEVFSVFVVISSGQKETEVSWEHGYEN